jgi:hypothetical protein
MSWRVVILAEVPNIVLGKPAVYSGLSHLNPMMESVGGTTRRIVLTADGTDALDAGASALREERVALGGHLKGESSVDAVFHDEQIDPAIVTGIP